MYISIISALVKQVRDQDFKWVKKTTRSHKERSCLKFGRELAHIDWQGLLKADSSPDDLVARFESIINEMTCRLFPERTIKHRSNEPLWITDGIRRLATYKRLVYRREGKTDYWKSLRDRQLGMIEGSKDKFVNGVRTTSGSSSAAYFRAVKALSTKGRPAPWEVSDLFPGDDCEKVGEEVATFFTQITDQFVPLQPCPPSGTRRRPVTTAEVAAKLKKARKPNSQVKGDVMPRLVKRFHHLLAVPATIIFNAVFRTASWPSNWKTETTVVIPKVAAPSSLAETRNISCTAFLSKVLESFLLEDLRSQLPLDPTQYGGIAGCSVNHLLIDVQETILSGLDEGKSTIMLGIDYQKAFNRMDHGQCLAQLEALGASESSIDLVRSFLTGRQMRVKVGQVLSEPHILNGGSPQGSILGPFLYCITTQQIGLNLASRGLTGVGARESTPNRSNGGNRSTPSPPFPADEIPAGTVTPNDRPVLPPSPEALAVPPCESPGIDGGIEMVKYIDDTTTLEVVGGDKGIRHYSALGPTEEVPAAWTNGTLANIIERSEDIGMRVNCAKTQAICISPDNGCTTKATIIAGEDTITTADTMKLLGFMFDSSGTANAQVDLIKDKFRARFWTLIHLKRAGLRGRHLLQMYNIFVRSVIEANSVVYHSMLNVGHTQDLERMQKLAAKLCYGFDRHYEEICRTEGLETLETRRRKAVHKFVQKNLGNARFADRWFVRRPGIPTDLRARRPFVEKRARTTRYLKSPLLYLQRTANDIVTADAR